MKSQILLKTALLLLLATLASCEREWDNPWDEKAALDPNAWAPQNLQITDVSITEKKLTWTYSDVNIEGFIIDRKVSNGNWQLAYTTVGKEMRSWNDNQIIPDPSLTFHYRIYAFAGQHFSSVDSSSVSSAFPAPTNLQITAESISSITLSWQDNNNGEEGFEIDRKVNSGVWEINYASVENNQNSYNDNNVDWQANEYTYRVYAFFGLYYSLSVESTISWPEVITSPATNISSTSATSGGSITIQGNYTISARGVCYSVTQNPDLSGPHTIDGSGAGFFISSISELNPLTSYNVSAYVTTNFNTVYGSQQNFITNLPAIGDNYTGGIVFYLDGSGGGLVCALNDQSTGAEWGCYGTTISGTGTAIGTGSSNTAAIVVGCSESGIAARICSDLALNGYSDWFLPSKYELDPMYVNLKQAGIGGFADDYYWSSSEYSSNYAWRQNFSSGNQGGNGSKDYNGHVRAVRAF